MTIRNLPSRTEVARSASSELQHVRRGFSADQTLVARKMALLMSTATDGIYIIDLHGCLIEFNESFSRMLGYQGYLFERPKTAEGFTAYLTGTCACSEISL
jgi:PAS domain-containing protein